MNTIRSKYDNNTLMKFGVVFIILMVIVYFLNLKFKLYKYTPVYYFYKNYVKGESFINSKCKYDNNLDNMYIKDTNWVPDCRGCSKCCGHLKDKEEIRQCNQVHCRNQFYD